MLLRRLDENAAAAPLLVCAALLSLGGAHAIVTYSRRGWTPAVRTRDCAGALCRARSSCVFQKAQRRCCSLLANPLACAYPTLNKSLTGSKVRARLIPSGGSGGVSKVIGHLSHFLSSVASPLFRSR